MRMDIFLGTVEVMLHHMTKEEREQALKEIQSFQDCYVPRQYENLTQLIVDTL